MMLGTERYKELKIQWGKDNQHLLKNVGAKKFRRKEDNTLWDGLDPSDNPNDYEEIWI